MSFLTDSGDMIFTGDGLLIRGCGRTDFQRALLSLAIVCGWMFGGLTPTTDH